MRSVRDQSCGRRAVLGELTWAANNFADLQKIVVAFGTSKALFLAYEGEHCVPIAALTVGATHLRNFLGDRLVRPSQPNNLRASSQVNSVSEGGLEPPRPCGH